MAPELGRYLVAFLLTVVLETTVALLLGYRKRDEMAAVFWVNVFTHPLLHGVLWFIDQYHTASLSVAVILAMEGIVVLLEWRLLAYALPRHAPRRLFLLALLMNAVSYLCPLPL